MKYFWILLFLSLVGCDSHSPTPRHNSSQPDEPLVEKRDPVETKQHYVRPVKNPHPVPVKDAWPDTEITDTRTGQIKETSK